MKYTAEFYRGRVVGKGGFMSRVGFQVVATDEITGKRRAVFDGYQGKTPCLKSQWVASHYSSGPNKYDQIRLNEYAKWAEETAKELNKTQPYR
jgi:hypothetical protein